ncbi:MAG: tetratricopeptide repeat protein [Bryobacterales bacterium]|nr:tetratricopeptide repeat protein [Bryobacterales bacterium]
MSKRYAIVTLIATSLLLALGSGCTQLKARDRVNKGVHAFKAAKYAEAVDHFRAATEIDPTFDTARLYLATAYYQQYIPGAESSENVEMANKAKEEYNKVLEKDPKNALALASIASLYFHQKNWNEAESWNKRLLEADPKNKEGYYTLGVIAWTRSFAKRMESRAKLGMKPEDPGPIKDKKVREELRGELLAMVNSGIDNLKKSIEVDAEYDDAMAYMNLLHRERADLQDTPEAYKQDVGEADTWVQKTMEVKKIKQERAAKAQPGGIVQDTK